MLGCVFKANRPLAGPWPLGGVPSVEIFLRDPSSIYASFYKIKMVMDTLM